MNDEARLLFELWEIVSEILPSGERHDAAVSMIRTLMEHGNDFALLRDAEGECVILDKAIEQVADEEAADADEYFDDYEEE